MKVAVYTCITGGYDLIHSPLISSLDIDYILFTDQPVKNYGGWRNVVLDDAGMSSKDLNRHVKMHPEKYLAEYDLTVYIDGNIQVVKNINDILIKVVESENEIFLYDHPERNCIYEEAAACIHYSHDWVFKISSQMRKYHKKGYPVNNGLYEANVIIRKRSARISQLMDAWWIEYSTGAKRDQLSLPVIFWENKVCIESLGKESPRIGNKYFQFHKHPKKEKKLSIIFRKYVNRMVVGITSYKYILGVACKASFKSL